MAIQILSNLNYPIGNIINQEMQNTQTARMAVAFLKYSGLKVIEQSMGKCLRNNGNIAARTYKGNPGTATILFGMAFAVRKYSIIK